MPILKQNFKHTGLTQAAISGFSTPVNYKNVAFSTSRPIQKEASTYFYNDLISLLLQTGLLQSYDTTKFSFTIFDEKFYCVCDSHTRAGINNRHAAAPRVFQDKCYDFTKSLVHSFVWNSNSLSDSTYNSNTWFGFNIFTDTLGRSEIIYSIRIFYNDNYVIAQFNGAEGQLCPLFFIVKGALINSTSSITYIGGCPNAIYDNNADNWVTRMGNTYTIQNDQDLSLPQMYVEHYMKADGKPLFAGYYDGNYQVFNYTGLNVYWMDDREDRLMTPLSTFQNKEEFYIKDANCFNAQITFDNMYIGDKKMSYDRFYKIGDDTYYVPGNAVVTNNNALRLQTSWPLFIFKI